MAVTKMTQLSIVGDISKLEYVLDICSSSGDFHIDQASNFFQDNSQFTSISDENPYAAPLSRLEEALSLARLDAPAAPAPFAQKELSEITAFCDSFSDHITALQGSWQQLHEQLDSCEHSIEQFEHFKGLGLKLDEIFACEYIRVRFGRIPKESFDKLQYYSDNPYIVCFPCTSDKQYVWGLYCAPIESINEVDRIFQSLYWERLWVPAAAGTPEEACSALVEERTKLTAELDAVKSEIDAYWAENKLSCGQLLDYLRRRRKNFDLRRYAARYNNSDVFFLGGWIPQGKEKSLPVSLEELGVECKLSRPEEDASGTPPVKLKNAGIFRPFEFFVEMYGLPSYHEIDPTPFVAITYFILFGIMFGDVGQGLVLMLVAYFFMWKMKNMKLGKPIALCGLSSAFFGVLFGSVFGYETWLNPFWGWVSSKTGLKLDEGKPINLESSETTLNLIYFAIGIGVVLVMIAIMLNIYSKLKQRMWGEALFGSNGLAGLIFYASLVGGVGGQLILGLEILSTPFILLCLVLPLLLIYLHEPLTALLAGEEHWMPEKIGEFLMQNFFELFEVLLSYASNTISFLRVGAFVLVHAGMMKVVFTLAGDQLGFGYFLAVIAGNIVIMCLEGLLVGIQALRLEFYEMFSRFFSGSGRSFEPVDLSAAAEKQ